MYVIKNKTIILIQIPPTYFDIKLCTLGIHPPSLFKISSFLKSNNNNVVLIPTTGGDETSDNYINLDYKLENIHIYKDIKKTISVAGIHPYEIIKKIKQNGIKKIEQIWVSSSFSCDYKILNFYTSSLKKSFPHAEIIVGGDAVRNNNKKFLANIKADKIFTERIPESDNKRMDTEIFKNLNYGVFQTQIGCPFSCSFCNIKDPPIKINIDSIITEIKEIYEKAKPKNFWNFDPNPLIFKEHLIKFLEKYVNLNLNSNLNFLKGFQVNRIDREIVELMKKAKVKLVTIPIETTTYKSAAKLNKPYTVITTIKKLQLMKELGFNLSHCPTTYLIGYPDDDLRSIFRAFLISIRYHTISSPFPVFIFPGNDDFKNYFPIIKDKDFSLLHGQLWPLLDENKIKEYEILLQFLIEKENDISKIPKKIKILPSYMRNLLEEEIQHFDKFIEKCLNSTKDNLDTLKKIEESLKTKKIRRKKLFIINSTISNKNKSISLKLKEIFISEVKKKISDLVINETYLQDSPPPYLNSQYIEIVYYKSRKLNNNISSKTKEIFKYIKTELKKIEEADIILITSPMYTLGIPAVLKCYFELISSYCYYYRKRMLNHKPVFCILTRGGSYPPNGIPYQKGFPFINSQELTLDAILDFLGISQSINYITCEKQDNPSENEKKIEFENAKDKIKKLIAQFTI